MKVNWVEKKEELERLIKEGVPYEQIGKIYGVSGNGVKKAAKRLNIELPIKRTINSSEHFNRGIKFKEQSTKNVCPVCGKLKCSTSKICLDCYNKKKRLIKEKTLGYFIDGEKYLTSKCTEIRKDAKRTLLESKREKVCAYCKNHEYDEILEVHHIKGILEFKKNDTIAVINDETNLVWLCPNHHALLEKGLITLQ